MKFMSKAKDGGPDSPVTAFFILEMKPFFTIAILKFNKGSREQFHTHAFNAYTWLLKGHMLEETIDNSLYTYQKSLVPKYTPCSKNHRVIAHTNSYCLTLRGPWSKTWQEYDSSLNKTTAFTHGRKVVSIK